MLKPIIDDLRARRISFFTALLLITAITLIFVHRILLPARLVMNFSWERFFADYKIFEGGLMGLIFLILLPLIASKLRSSI